LPAPLTLEYRCPMSKRIAIVDMGSNAVRFAVVDAGRNFLAKKRAAIRLGEDVFSTGNISEEKIASVIEAFREFKTLADEIGATQWCVYATSATRDARNQQEFIQKVFVATGLRIEVLSGDNEAEWSQGAVDAAITADGIETKDQNWMTMDVGGGSVEFVLRRGDLRLGRKSFPLGMVRILKELSIDKNQNESLSFNQRDQLLTDGFLRCMQPAFSFIRDEFYKFPREGNGEGDGAGNGEGNGQGDGNGEGPLSFIAGAGGNFEDLNIFAKNSDRKTGVTSNFPSSSSGSSSGKLTQYSNVEITELSRLALSHAPSQLQKNYGLTADRSDLIGPCLKMTELLMTEFAIPRLIVPGVGLVDGIALHHFEG
jgi:exopolyphosphatase/pppGpp-phosphohydrolase